MSLRHPVPHVCRPHANIRARFDPCYARSLIWMRHVTYVTESRHKYAWVMAHVWLHTNVRGLFVPFCRRYLVDSFYAHARCSVRHDSFIRVACLTVFVHTTRCDRATQHVHVCCSVLQCVAVCCSMLQCVAVCSSGLHDTEMCVVVCCSVLQCVAVCHSVLQCVAVCCSVAHDRVMYV